MSRVGGTDVYYCRVGCFRSIAKAMQLHGEGGFISEVASGKLDGGQNW